MEKHKFINLLFRFMYWTIFFCLCGSLYVLAWLLSVTLFQRGLVFLSVEFVFLFHSLFMLFYVVLKDEKKVSFIVDSAGYIRHPKYSSIKYVKFFGITIFALSFSLIIEYLLHLCFLNAGFPFNNMFVQWSFVYVLSAIALSLLLVKFVNMKISIIDFQFLAGVCVLTLFIHLILIALCPGIPVIFFRCFGFILDVYLLLQFLGIFYFQISCNNSFLQWNANLPYA